ncbi:MAG: ABC transporter permease [Pseudomonadota bacterium]
MTDQTQDQVAPAPGAPKSSEQPDRQGFAKILYNVGLLRESWAAIIGISIVLFWVIVALFAPVLAPYDPNESDFTAAMQGPSALHWLGTDDSGRDILSRIIFGAQRILSVAPIAMIVAYAVGIALGVLSGYFGGWVDSIVSFVVNIILSFPLIILFIVLLSAFGPSAVNVVVAVTAAASPAIARIVRGLVLDIRGLEYVSAAQIRGETSFYIMLVELLPNARGPIIVDACLRMGYTIIAIGVLGFLGLGLPPPDPDWGSMVSQARAMITVFPHMAIFPSIAISSLVIGFNLLADGLREISLRD